MELRRKEMREQKEKREARKRKIEQVNIHLFDQCDDVCSMLMRRFLR